MVIFLKKVLYKGVRGYDLLIHAINNFKYYNGNTPAKAPEAMRIKPSLNELQTDTVSFSSKPRLTRAQLEQISDLRVFNHHIYEFKKGIRNLILTTEKSKYLDTIKNRLNEEKIDYFIGEHKNKHLINVYFGKKQCIEVVKTFDKDLSKLSPEQDFILGTMLGYDNAAQCERYLQFKHKQGK